MSDFIPAFCFYSSTPGLHGKRGYPWDGGTCYPMTLGIAEERLTQGETAICYPRIPGDSHKLTISIFCRKSAVDFSNRGIGIYVSP